LISRGRDVSESFPYVVKNVVCPSIEVKKLVYMFLVHYAEREPDAALLSISTLQKDLNDKNQLIRAQALRVLSSIRVPVIANIVVIAIRQCVSDLSPYVRKTAAHAITKVFNLDPSQLETLIEAIGQLLNDRTTMVLGSAVTAFMEVCPTRYDLIHKNYRKLCDLLVDTDEWGQVSVVNMLMRYGRTQFLDPNPNAEERKRRKALLRAARRAERKADGSDGDEFSDDDDDDDGDSGADGFYDQMEMDSDHRHLLNCAAPLLQSRNAAVVMAVSSLYYYLAPTMEAQKVGKPLARIARKGRELQYLVLTNIASLAMERPEMFSPHLSDFFVRSSDPSFSRALKLEILTCLATESTIARILREFGAYVRSSDKQFVTSTVRAIGRCSTRVPDVADSCMQGLMALLSSPQPAVVAEAVVEIKKMLQSAAIDDKQPIITHLAKMLGDIEEPNARGSILWIVGEYCEQIPLHAPDILRRLAQTFVGEADVVKLQVLNLGAKLFVANAAQTMAIFRHVLTLAKYDVNYDIRDRARMMRVMLLNVKGNAPDVVGHARRLVFTAKPTPAVHNPSAERSRFAIGSLSHCVAHTVPGYAEIPEHTDEPSDSSVRAVPIVQGSLGGGSGVMVGFGSGSAAASRAAAAAATAELTFDDWIGGGSDDDDESYDSEDYEYSDDGEYSGEYSDEFSGEDGEFFSDDEEDEFSDDEEGAFSDDDAPAAAATRSTFSSSDLLSGFAEISSPSSSSAASPSPVASSSPSAGASLGLLAPTTGAGASGSAAAAASLSSSASTASLPSHKLVSSVVSGGLGGRYSFLRRVSTYGDQYSSVQLTLRNETTRSLSNIQVASKQLASGQDLVPFPLVGVLQPGASIELILNARFTSVRTPIKFELAHDAGKASVQIAPDSGELLKPVAMSVAEFDAVQGQLGGLNEQSIVVSLAACENSIDAAAQRIVQSAHVNTVAHAADHVKFSARSMLHDGQQQLLIALRLDNAKATLTVNCEDAVLRSILITKIKNALIQ
jgi:AP-3 complex subunit beta